MAKKGEKVSAQVRAKMARAQRARWKKLKAVPEQRRAVKVWKVTNLAKALSEVQTMVDQLNEIERRAHQLRKALA